MRLSNPTPRSLFTTLASTLAAVLTLTLLGQPATYAQERAGETARAFAAAAKPLVNLGDRRAVTLAFKGSAEAVAALEGGKANPTALAQGDINADGAVDVVAGYATPEGGVVTLLMGNPDAFAPKDSSLFVKAMRGQIAETFLPEAAAYELPESPDMIVTGDFNRDGDKDVLVASRGGGLYLLAGDGHGTLRPAERVPLEGKVWGMAVTPDGHVAVSMEGNNGPELRILVPGEDGLSEGRSYALPARGTSVAFGDLGGGWDVAVAAGHSLVTIYKPLTDESKTETTDLGFKAVAVTLGDFVWDREGRTEISVLAEDGTIHILQHGTLDTRPLTAADGPGRRAGLKETRKQQRLNPTSMGAWTVAKEVRNPAAAPAGAMSQTAFSSPHLAAAATNDLMVLDAERSQLHILDTSGKAASPSATISLPGAPVAALALPQKIDAHRETIVLVKGSTRPIAFDQGTDPTYNVTTTADEDDAGACGSSSSVTVGAGADGKLSLREAICEANNGGAATYTINVPAGTYSLTKNLFAGGQSASSSGELQVGFSSGSNFTISGAGAGSTIIQQTNNVDRVMEQDELQDTNITLTLQNLTLSGGLCSTGLDCGFSGGALLAGGVSGDGATLTSVTISNNSEQADTPALGGGNQGGGVSMAGPGFTITNSTFSGNSLTATSSNAGTGGGVEFLDDIAGSLTVTGSTFTGNTVQATSNGAIGGGMSIELNAIGDTASISGSTFTGNAANGSNGQGGAIYSIGLTTVTNSRITGNVAGNSGGGGGGSGFWEQGYAGNPSHGIGTVKNNWWGCNTGPNTSGCDTVAISPITADDASVVDTPYLVLTLGANPNSVQINGTSTLTASITTNSSNGTGFSVPNGTAVAFGVSVSSLGIDNPTSSTLTSGSATSTFTGGTPGTGNVTATVDNATASAAMTVLGTPPTILTANSTTFTVGSAGSFNVVTTGNPTATLSDGGAALPSGVTFTNNGNGTATLAGTPAAGTAGTYNFTVTASNGVNPNATQGFTLTVHQAPAIISGNSTTFTAGTTGSFTVSTSGSPTPGLSKTGTLPTGVNFIDNGNGTATLSGSTTAAGSYPITITANNGVSPNATQNFTLTVSPGAVSHFSVSAPPTTTAGSSFPITVTALDAFGNTATSYAGTVHFTSTDPTALLPANSTLANGVGTESVTLETAGNQTITATDTVTSAITGSASVSVSPGAAVRLFWSGPTIVGSNNNDQYTITAQDQFGNTATGYNGTALLTSSDPGFVPSSGNPVTFTSGVVSGYNLVLKTAGVQTVTARDTTNPSITGSISINVLPGAAVRFGVSVPVTAVSGVGFNFTLTAYDLAGNVATGYTGTTTFTSTDPSAGLPVPSNINAGSGVFPATLVTPGVQTITATDSTNSLSVTSSPIDVTPAYLVVNTANDDSGTAANCTLQTLPGSNTSDSACSLRDALLNAAGRNGQNNITFDSTAFAAPSTIPLTFGTLNVPSNTSITGPTTGSGATLSDLVTVSGSALSTVFTVNSGVTAASIAGLTITDGSATGGAGGGISNSGTLSVTNSTISGSTATGSGGTNGTGGGIYNAGTLTLTGSTVSGNLATATGGGVAYGGGIYSNEAGLTISNSTISGNSVTAGGLGLGGGISTQGGALTLTGSTISGNTADGEGGGFISGSTTASLGNNILSGNLAPTGTDFFGSAYSDNGGNLIGGTVVLAPLANYGGPTQTLLPLPGSTAVCGGTVANATGLSTDQRGFARTTTYNSVACADAGAVQTGYTSVQFNSASYTSNPGYAVAPPPVVSVTENGQNIGGLPITLVFTGNGTVSGLGPVTTVAGTGATFGALEVSTRDVSDVLSVSLPITALGNAIQPAPLTASAALQVVKATSSVVLTPNSNPLTAGSTLIMTATVTGALPGITPTGNVKFYVDGGSPGIFPLVNGVATYTTSTLTSGVHLIGAQYAGDVNYNGSRSNGVDEVLGQQTSSVVVVSSLNPAPAGTAFTLTATVTGAGPTPTGTVNFYNGNILIGAEPLSGGVAVLPSSALNSDNSIISAYYLGDGYYQSAKFTGLNQVITKATTTVSLVSSMVPAIGSTPFTLTATVAATANGVTPTGNVAFFVDGVSQVLPLVNGTASLIESGLPFQEHQIGVRYSGDQNYLGAVSSVLYLPVSKEPSTFGLSSSMNPAPVGTAITFTATVQTTLGTTVATGLVTFYSGNMQIGQQALNGSGVATLQVTTLPADYSLISARYLGDGNYLPATASGFYQTLTRVTTQITLTPSASSISVGTLETVTANLTSTVPGTPPSGNVVFFIDNVSQGSTALVGGSASIGTSSLTAGSHTFGVQYGGDTNYVGGAAVPITVTVTP